MKGGNVRAEYPAQEHNTRTSSGLKLKPFNQDSRTQTSLPPYLVQLFFQALWWMINCTEYNIIISLFVFLINIGSCRIIAALKGLHYKFFKFHNMKQCCSISTESAPPQSRTPSTRNIGSSSCINQKVLLTDYSYYDAYSHTTKYICIWTKWALSSHLKASKINCWTGEKHP